MGKKFGKLGSAIKDRATTALFGGDDLTKTYYTKKSLGKIEGYSQYTARYGYANWIGMPTSKLKITEDLLELDKSGIDYESQINPYIDGYQKGGFGSENYEDSDSFGDPTYLVYDLFIDYDASPLFGIPIDEYLTEYSELVPEISERVDMYYEFYDDMHKIFAQKGQLVTESNKRHYIQSISGLDLLFKKIINYPDDKLTFTLTEDVTLFAQNLSESYNNLVYSYDTHRHLIPDNLLLFDLRIEFSDIRTLTKVDYQVKQPLGEKDKTIFNKSKFIYILHDCMFDFTTSRSIGDESVVGGWNAAVDTTPASLTFDITFKSYSKITVPAFSDYKSVNDFRKRENVEKEAYQPDVNYDEQKKLMQDIKVTADGGLMGKAKDAIVGELKDIRGTLLNKVKEQTQKLAGAVQEKIAGNLGFSITKFNVYIDSAAQALDGISGFVGDFVDDKIIDPLSEEFYGETDRSPVVYREGSVYSGSEYSNDKDPSSIKRFDDGTYNEKYPDGDVFEDGTYNEKYPDGDVFEDGTYNEKYPDENKVVFEDGTYNEKYPEKDVFEDGTYNEKYPDENNVLFEDGTYNEKLPDGDIFEDGTYNQKYPDNSKVFEDGTYNEKHPDGDKKFEDGTYNEKYPSGDKKFEDGTYNEKYPEKDIFDDGTYNEKYPSGDKVFDDGTYNEKHPDGDVFEDGTYNEKYPSGDKKFEDGTYNEKYPSGDKKFEDGTYNEKLPEGDVFEDGTYNQKLPDGDKVFEDGTYSQKLPDGVVHDKHGQTFINFPEGNVYGKKEDTKDNKPTGNLYKK